MANNSIYEVAKEVNDSFFLRKSESPKVNEQISNFKQQLEVS
jgi:hypothetical protein